MLPRSCLPRMLKNPEGEADSYESPYPFPPILSKAPEYLLTGTCSSTDRVDEQGIDEGTDELDEESETHDNAVKQFGDQYP